MDRNITRLNALTINTDWCTLYADEKKSIAKSIRVLNACFTVANLDRRACISYELNDSAKYLLATFAKRTAERARETHAADTLREAFIPVVMAGGRADSRTGGFLFSILLRTAEALGLDGRSLFAEMAALAVSAEATAELKTFPTLSDELTRIQSWGVKERSVNGRFEYEAPGDAASRSRWWERLIGRRRPSKEEMLASSKQRNESMLP